MALIAGDIVLFTCVAIRNNDKLMYDFTNNKNTKKLNCIRLMLNCQSKGRKEIWNISPTTVIGEAVCLALSGSR